MFFWHKCFISPYLYQPTHESSVLGCFFLFLFWSHSIVGFGWFCHQLTKVCFGSRLSIGVKYGKYDIKLNSQIHGQYSFYHDKTGSQFILCLFQNQNQSDRLSTRIFLIKITCIPNSLYWLWVKVFHDIEFANMKFSTMSDFCYDNKNIRLPHSCFSHPTLSEMFLLPTEREYSFSI